MNELVTGLRPYIHGHDPDPWRMEGAVFTDYLAEFVPELDRPATGLHVFPHPDGKRTTAIGQNVGITVWILSDRGAMGNGHAAALTVAAAVAYEHDDTALFDVHWTGGMQAITAPELGRMLRAVESFYATLPEGEAPLIAGRMPYGDPGRVADLTRQAVPIPDPDTLSGLQRRRGGYQGMSHEEAVEIAVKEAARRGHTAVRRNPEGQQVWRGWCVACHMDLMVFPATMGGDCLLKDCPMVEKTTEITGE